MRIVTVNVNGIRAAERKGLFPWLQTTQADVICLQEVRADASILKKTCFHLDGYTSHYVPAERKGYSGVGILTRLPAHTIETHIGLDWADQEGRYVACEFKHCKVASLYLPSGSHNPERQTQKYAFMEHVYGLLQKALKAKKPLIMCGDWNIAHTKKDIKNWRSNQKNSGFLPEERAWLDTLYDDLGYIDAFREVCHDDDAYTWWSNRGRAWENNVGWRLDYQVIPPKLAGTVQSASIYKDVRFSDHAPVTIDYQLHP